MKRTLFTIIIILFIENNIYSQKTEYVKQEGYEGYIFPREYSIWGFPPEKGRYTPTLEDIARAEEILIDSINSEYVKSNQKAYKKPPINRKALKKYVRQYVGYLTENNEIVIWINLLHRNGYDDGDTPRDAYKIYNEIITVLDGGYYFWSICINIITKELSDMKVNGES
jgi:hypothetical protein